MSVLWQHEQARGTQWRLLPLGVGGLCDREDLPFQLVSLCRGGDAGMALLVPLETMAFVNGELLLGGLRAVTHAGFHPLVHVRAQASPFTIPLRQGTLCHGPRWRLCWRYSSATTGWMESSTRSAELSMPSS